MTDKMFDRFGVIKVAGVEPETFMVAFLDSALKNPWMRTSKGLTEVETRAELEKMEFAPARIDELIATARANPK